LERGGGGGVREVKIGDSGSDTEFEEEQGVDSGDSGSDTEFEEGQGMEVGTQPPSLTCFSPDLLEAMAQGVNSGDSGSETEVDEGQGMESGLESGSETELEEGESGSATELEDEEESTAFGEEDAAYNPLEATFADERVKPEEPDNSFELVFADDDHDQTQTEAEADDSGNFADVNDDFTDDDVVRDAHSSPLPDSPVLLIQDGWIGRKQKPPIPTPKAKPPSALKVKQVLQPRNSKQGKSSSRRQKKKVTFPVLEIKMSSGKENASRKKHSNKHPPCSNTPSTSPPTKPSHRPSPPTTNDKKDYEHKFVDTVLPTSSIIYGVNMTTVKKMLEVISGPPGPHLLVVPKSLSSSFPGSASFPEVCERTVSHTVERRTKNTKSVNSLSLTTRRREASAWINNKAGKGQKIIMLSEKHGLDYKMIVFLDFKVRSSVTTGNRFEYFQS
jgi:hypothetical protein